MDRIYIISVGNIQLQVTNKGETNSHLFFLYNEKSFDRELKVLVQQFNDVGPTVSNSLGFYQVVVK